MRRRDLKDRKFFCDIFVVRKTITLGTTLRLRMDRETSEFCPKMKDQRKKKIVFLNHGPGGACRKTLEPKGAKDCCIHTQLWVMSW